MVRPIRELRIRPRNPADFRDGELEELARQLRTALPRTYRVEFQAPPEQRGYGVTWYEIIEIWTNLDPILKGAAGASAREAIAKVVREFRAWAARRKKRKDSTRRPTYARIYGPRGEILKAIVVDERGKAVDKTAEEQRLAEISAESLRRAQHPDAT